MRIPHVKNTTTGPLLSIPLSAGESPRSAAQHLSNFLRNGNPTLVLTGAGISTESGIPDYRGPSGTYTTKQSYRPIFFHEFVGQHKLRQRYWARSFLGYPPVLRARPNQSHISLARMYKSNLISHILTQNVDSLHHAGFIEAKVVHDYEEAPMTELHGTLRNVICLTCTTRMLRSEFQKGLIDLNPDWAWLLKLDDTQLRTNADGDVDLPSQAENGNEMLSYQKFRYPACKACSSSGRDVKVDSDGAWMAGSEGLLKPTVVFFGETVNPKIKEQADNLLNSADRLLVIGTSLATYSAYRLVKRAKEVGKKVALINWGGSVRGEDELIQESNGDLRIWFKSGLVLTSLLDILHNARA
jgi:NAD-dependent SIR2 family protein deacetylase